MDREWEKFKDGPFVATTDRMHVTMSKSGLIFMNRNTHRLLERPLAVYLYFNRSKDLIALQPASPRMPKAFPVKEKLSGWIVRAGPFCRHFGIRLDKTIKFVQPEIDNAGQLLLDLSEIVDTGGPFPRRRK